MGKHIEWRNGTLTKYYYVGSTRVAMREGDTLSFILANQLGSATVTLDSAGSVQSELRYHPFGETRHSDGTTPTNRRFTGQIQDEGTGLYYYNARYYDPSIGRFIQADTIVPEPGNPQSLNRYSYVLNNPLKYTDPTGHFTEAAVQNYLNENSRSIKMFGVWRQDSEWWKIMSTAQGGDTVALINSDGSTSWYNFEGSGDDKLDKIHKVSGPGKPEDYGNRPMSAESVEGVRASYNLMGGLFSSSRNGTPFRRWGIEGMQQGRNGLNGIVHYVRVIITPEIYAAQKGGAMIGGAIAGGIIGGVNGAVEGSMITLSPIGAAVGGAMGLAAGVFIGSTTETALSPYPVGTIRIGLVTDLFSSGGKYGHGTYHGRQLSITTGIPTPTGKGYHWSNSSAYCGARNYC